MYCALCRRAGVQGKEPRPASPTTDWQTRALHALNELAASGTAFTSEDLTDKIGFPAAHRQNANNKIGTLIQANAHRLGLRRLRMEKARNPRSNGRLITVWIHR